MSNKPKKVNVKRDPGVNLFAKFAPTENDNKQDWKSQTLPPLLKPANMHGHTVAGSIENIVNGVGKFKNRILVLKHECGEEFCVPMTAVIARAIGNYKGLDSDKVKAEDVRGLRVKITGTGKVATKDGKRSVNLFEVSIAASNG